MDRGRRDGSAFGDPVRRFEYQPALDGVRALAVAAVLVFHAGYGWMSGGYVGVSVFFTLSGYLITSLAMVEHAATGRLDVGAFYARRIRRLLPASVLCLVGVVVLAWLGLFDGVPHLRRSLWGALAQVYNWVSLAGSESYADLVSGGAARARPLEHYWSLAIEEQFYWVWPLALVVILRRSARGRLAVLAGLTLLAGVAAPVIAGVWGPDAAYWATPARLGEILVGALLAGLLQGVRRDGRVLPRWLWLVAPAALVAIGWAAVTWPAGRGPAYEGWFPVFALASAGLVLGLQVDGPARWALSRRPLVALGAISYGVYLFHWPIYAVLDEQRVGGGRTPLFALRIAVTLVVATASYLLVERPVRRARWTVRPVSTRALAGCGALALVVAVLPVERAAFFAGDEEARADVSIAPAASLEPLEDLAVTTEPPDTTTDASTTLEAAETTTSTPASSPAAPPTTPVALSTTTTTTTTTPAPPRALRIGPDGAVPSVPDTLTRPVRVLVIGDSTASAIGEGLVAEATAHPERLQVTIRWSVGCGFVRVGAEQHEVPEFQVVCDRLRAELPADITALQPDVVVLMATISDTEGRLVEPGAPLLFPGDDGFEELIRAEYQRFLDDLLALGVPRVAWVVPPPPDMSVGGVAPNLRIPERWTTLRAAVEGVADANPDVVSVVDMAAWEAAQPASGRPDGIHYSAEAATRMADAWLVPWLVDVAVRPR